MAQLRHLQERYDNQESALAIANDRATTAESTLAAATDRATTAESALAAANSHITTITAAESAATDRITIAESALAAANDRATTAESAIAAATDRATTAESTLAAANDHITTAESALAAANDHITTAESALAAANNRATIAESALATATDRATIAESALAATNDRAATNQNIPDYVVAAGGAALSAFEQRLRQTLGNPRALDNPPISDEVLQRPGNIRKLFHFLRRQGLHDEDSGVDDDDSDSAVGCPSASRSESPVSQRRAREEAPGGSGNSRARKQGRACATTGDQAPRQHSRLPTTSQDLRDEAVRRADEWVQNAGMANQRAGAVAGRRVYASELAQLQGRELSLPSSISESDGHADLEANMQNIHNLGNAETEAVTDSQLMLPTGDEMECPPHEIDVRA